MNRARFFYRLAGFALLPLLASCGASPHNIVPLPAVKPPAKAVNTPYGPISVVTAKSIPTSVFKKYLIPIGMPYMSSGGTSHPAKEDAWPGKKFVIVAFEQPPVMRRNALDKPALVVTGAAEPTQLRWFCCHYVAQNGKDFDCRRAFMHIEDEKTYLILSGTETVIQPFAFAFQVPENSTGGTLSLNKALYSIQW